MAVRFYVLNEAVPYTPPAWDGGFDIVNVATPSRRAFDPHKFGSEVPISTTFVTDSVTTSPYHLGVIQLVSRRLKPNQTITGTVDMIIAPFGSGGDAEFFTRLHIYVIDTSDDSIVGVLLNEYQESSGGGATEWAEFVTGTALQAPQALTSVLVPNDSGDYRLVAEIGCNAENTHATARLAGMRYGAVTSTYAPLPDLEVGMTSTATRTHASFLEFSFDIELADDVVPNVTVTTAIPIPVTGVTHTQDAYDAGYTYGVWYSYTAGAGEVFISIWGFGDLTTYKPLLRVYTAGGVLHVVSDEADTRRNKPLEIVTTPGTTYYFFLTPNTGNPTPADLSIIVEPAPTTAAPAGSLLVIDDTFGYPAALLSDTTGAVLRFVTPFAASEGGAILANGISLFVDLQTDGIFTESSLRLYDPSLNLITTIPLETNTQSPVTSNHLDKFWIADGHTPAGVIDSGSIHVVTSAGVHVGKVADTGVSSPRQLNGIAVSPDETILYYTRLHLMDGMEAGPVFRWNLTTDTAMTNLAATVSNYHCCREILCLPDGTVLVSYRHFNPATPDAYVNRYDPSNGAILNTYQLETDVAISEEIRLAHDPDYTSFWVWTKKGTSSGLSMFRHINVADGADMVTPFEVPYFNTGLYAPPATATPDMFGHSFSCPFVVIRSAAVAAEPTGVIGPLVWVHMTRRI